MSATITPTCNSASTASCCPTASPASAAFSTPSLIGSMSLVTGALPAEFGMRTVGLVDITTRNDIFNNSGSVSLYGGSRGTIQPSFEYGGTFGNNCPRDRHAGAEARRRRPPTASPACSTSSPAAICKPRRASKIRCRRSTPSTTFSQQEKGFAYMSTFVDPLYALEPDCRHLHQQVPDSQRARPARRLERKSAGHQRVRHHDFQFGAAQREPVRGHPVRRAGAAAFGQRL